MPGCNCSLLTGAIRKKYWKHVDLDTFYGIHIYIYILVGIKNSNPQQWYSWIYNAADTNLCDNSFSSFRQLCKYIKYRITGSVSHISIQNANLLELRTLERKFQHRESLCNVQGFQKYPLCVVY